MSLENLKEYARRCATDPEMTAMAKEIGIEDIGQHISYSESMGLEWDKDDWLAFREEVVERQRQFKDDYDLEDLGEDELEMIAGGLFSVTVVSAVAVGAAVGGSVAAVGATAATGGAAAAGDGGW